MITQPQPPSDPNQAGYPVQLPPPGIDPVNGSLAQAPPAGGEPQPPPPQ